MNIQRRYYTKSKIVVCFGKGYKDFVMYLSFVLNNMGYRVLVEDQSKNRELAHIISHNDFSTEIRTYRNIDFCFSDKIRQGYDFILIYGNEKEMLHNVVGCRYLIVNTCASKSELYICEDVIGMLSTDTMFVLRDQVGSIGRKYIGKYMITTERLIGIYEVRYDEYDKEYQYSMDYDGVQSFKYLSDDFCKVLIRCITVLTGKGQEVIKKALKWAKGGKVFDNRFLE